MEDGFELKIWSVSNTLFNLSNRLYILTDQWIMNISMSRLMGLIDQLSTDFGLLIDLSLILLVEIAWQVQTK